MTPRLFLACASVFLLTAPTHAQGTWSMLDAGIGILDTSQAPPRIVERDRGEWFLDDLTAKVGGRRMFMFWVVGPRPDSFRNRFGIPVYSFKYRQGPQGQPLSGSLHSFTDEGWGTYQLEYRPGSYQVEIFLVNRDTQEERLIKSLTYRVSPGKGAGGGQPQDPSRPEISTRPGGGPDAYLSDLQEATSGHIHGGLGKDRPYWAPRLILGGRNFAKGLVTHPIAGGERAFVEYTLGGQYRQFLATLGSAADGANCGQGTMNFSVIVDGRIVQQGRFPTPPATREISVDVKGARTLRLEVDNGGDGNAADHAAWGDARLRR